jgi:hypothetical protein
MDNKLYRVWILANGDETPANTPVNFADARLTMRLKGIEAAKRLGWRMLSQGVDYMIFRMPGGTDYELRIRCETPEATAYEAAAGIRYTVDEGLEYVSDYTITANMSTPTDSLFALREGVYPQAKWEVAQNGN